MSATRKFAALALAGALLAGCHSAPPLTAGTVTAKEHDPEHTETYFIPICTLVGKITVCNQIPETEHHAECWKLSLRNGKRKGHVCVSDRVYRQTDVGSIYQAPAS